MVTVKTHLIDESFITVIGCKKSEGVSKLHTDQQGFVHYVGLCRCHKYFTWLLTVCFLKR